MGALGNLTLVLAIIVFIFAVVGARGLGAAGVARGGVERRPPPSGPAPQLGWGRAALLVAQLSSSL